MNQVPVNRFKAALSEGRYQRGVWCTINDTLVTEMMAGSGFDWMMFDTEHSPLDALSVLPHFQAAAPYDVSAMVRPRSLDAPEIKKLLDFGAQNILVPYVQTVDEARFAVASVSYPPQGVRGVSAMTRATRFATIAEYHKFARTQIVLIVQLESVEALGCIEDIAALDGIDAVFLGPADLAASMGYPGEPGHRDVKAAVLRAIGRVRAAGKPAGLLAVDPALVSEARDAGASFCAEDVDMVALKRGLRRA